MKHADPCVVVISSVSECQSRKKLFLCDMLKQSERTHQVLYKLLPPSRAVLTERIYSMNSLFSAWSSDTRKHQGNLHVLPFLSLVSLRPFHCSCVLRLTRARFIQNSTFKSHHRLFSGSAHLIPHFQGCVSACRAKEGKQAIHGLWFVGALCTNY